MIDAMRDLFYTFGKLIEDNAGVVLIIGLFLIIIDLLIKDAHNSR